MDATAEFSTPASVRSRPPDITTHAEDLSSSITFPSSQDAPAPIPSPAVRTPTRPFLPFRRISLSSEPGSLYRESVVSAHSFDSLPEDKPAELKQSPSTSTSALTPKSAVAVPLRKPRPTSMIGPARTRMRADSRRRRNETISGQDKEAKRRNVVAEILETENSYVRGLDLIYDHFLVPLVESLETPQAILSRTELHSVFINFIDIWNFHRSFQEALTTLVTSDPNPPLAPLFAEHFPYLSLYTPFITTFPDSVAAMNSLSASNPRFGSFLRTQQADPKCKLLGLRDFLLTIVQRCPRYLLLLKDLISCTEPLSDEYEGLSAVHTLVAKITSALNTSLHSHTQTLLLLAIQRSTPNLPFPLIAPGRTLLRTGTLLKVDREQRLREFLLLSDSLVWLSKGTEREWSDWVTRPGIHDVLSAAPSLAALNRAHPTSAPDRPSLGPRKRSKSDAELPKWRSSTDVTQPNGEERWTFRGRFHLMDIEVVVSTNPGPSEGRKFDIFGPSESFGVYTSSSEERDEWVQAIRSAKASLMMSLSITHPDTTLTSSSSNAHLRHSLQALPHVPDPVEDSPRGKGKAKGPRRGKVEHFVPPVWVPDAKTDACMRCSRMFGLLRRRHHCRLCGRVVCAECSNRTFYIADPSEAKPLKPARACNACYESVFPILPSSPTISPRPLSSPTFPQPPNRPSAMHIPTLPDIPSHRSLAQAAESPPLEPDQPWLRPTSSPASLNDPLPPTSASLPANLPTTPPLPSWGSPVRATVEELIPDPPPLSRLSSYTLETTASAPSPPSEHLHQFTLPIPLHPPSSYIDPSTSRQPGPSSRAASKSPERNDQRRTSRASLPALRDSFYRHSREVVDSIDDLPPDLAEAENVKQDPVKIRKGRRITFAPSSAVHKAPVTIYPSKGDDQPKRFSLVLSGKGTVGRGAGLDIGSGDGQDDMLSSPDASVVQELPQATGSSSSLSTGTPTRSRSRRMVFEGLERGVAAGKLSWLLGRDKKSRGTVGQKSPPVSSP